ncbi:MAG: hypothetical protein WC829_09885 [Hyphomicrobium sp.]|jgi:hypothetical protein
MAAHTLKGQLKEVKMIKNILLKSFIGAILVALSGCTTIVADHSWTRCDLIRIAFEEQDELSPGWYDSALKEMRYCGMSYYSVDAAKDRGKS